MNPISLFISALIFLESIDISNGAVVEELVDATNLDGETKKNLKGLILNNDPISDDHKKALVRVILNDIEDYQSDRADAKSVILVDMLLDDVSAYEPDNRMSDVYLPLLLHNAFQNTIKTRCDDYKKNNNNENRTRACHMWPGTKLARMLSDSKDFAQLERLVKEREEKKKAGKGSQQE